MNEINNSAAAFNKAATSPLWGLSILGTGSMVPPLTVDNHMFAEHIDTNDEWIATRTGIKERHFVKDEDHRQMAAIAAKQAIDKSGINKEDIAYIICATITPDYATPSMACLIQKDLGLPEQVLAFDINGACSGYVYALNIAHKLLQEKPKQYALVIGSEIMSRITDFEDRSTCILFGDGAGASIIGLKEEAPYYFMAGSQGDAELLVAPSYYEAQNPFAKQPAKDKTKPFVYMNGNEIYRFAVEKFGHCAKQVLAANNLAADDIDHYICHQANLRIIQGAAKRLKVSLDKFFTNVQVRGNTSAASIAIALAELEASGKLKRGDKLLLAGFGGGLTYGAIYFEW